MLNANLFLQNGHMKTRFSRESISQQIKVSSFTIQSNESVKIFNWNV